MRPCCRGRSGRWDAYVWPNRAGRYRLRMTYQSIRFEQSGPVARITLDRPDAANGMNDTMTRELADAAARCDTPATKAVVLTGAGRFFCAGGDLKSFATAPSRGRFIKGVADDLHR